MKDVLKVKGEIYEDHRGKIYSFNNFEFKKLKRFYIINHPKKNIIRAWQGHHIETKFFKCINGSFVIAWKKIFKNREKINNEEANYEIINSNSNKILKIPAGYANGLKALKDNSSILVFSDLKLSESKVDKVRYESNLWMDWSKF